MEKIFWKTERRKVAELLPYEQNPRQLNKKQFEDLKKSLTKFDLVEIPAVDVDNKIIAGHQRISILKSMGRTEEEIDVRVPSRKLTEEEFLEYNLRSNKNVGDWDLDMLATFDNDLLKTVGFDENELRQIHQDFGGWNPPKTDEAALGDGIFELAGYGLQSFWKDIRNENVELNPFMIDLPTQEEQNLVRQKYSKTNLEEIRRVVKTYMRQGDYFLENCCGWSTFGTMAKFFGYSGVGVDIWETAIEHSKRQLDVIRNEAKVEIMKMDGMALDFAENTFDYVYCNPPFMDEEKYSGGDNDIADGKFEDFGKKFIQLMSENHRVLKPGKLCTITINDKREKGVLIPLQKFVIDWGFAVGFKLHDFVVAEVQSQKIRLRKKDYERKRTVKCHEYVITFIKPDEKCLQD